MPFPFEEEDKRHEDGGHLYHEILSEYLVEYKSQTRDFKENQLSDSSFNSKEKEDLAAIDLYCLHLMGHPHAQQELGE